MKLDLSNAATMNSAWERCQDGLQLRKIDVFDAFSAVELME